MANDPGDAPHPAVSPASATRAAPLAGTRSQAMQRLQIGLFGLAAMVLLVALANIVISNLRRNEAGVVPEAAPSVAAESTGSPARDPLAEAGVVPEVSDDPRPRPIGTSEEGSAARGPTEGP